MFTEILSDTAGQAALSRFFTTNTWNAQQIFKSLSATVAGGVFQSSGTISAIPAGYGGSTVVAQFIGEESSAFPYTLYDATGNAQGHILAFRASRGTYASRTAVQNGDILGQLDFGGYNSSSMVNGKGAFRAYASQTWTTTANGTRLECYITPNGSTANAQVFVMESSLVYSLTALQGFQSVRASGSAGNVRDFRLTTSTSLRWSLIANATAESSTATGSDFEFRRYNNSAVDLGLVMAVTRSTGNITFNGGGGTTTFSANKINISTAQSPASNATGTAGDHAWDADYIYICTATDTWKRVALTGGY